MHDSATDGRARLSFHTSFENPLTTEAPPRESIEVRALVSFPTRQIEVPRPPGPIRDPGGLGFVSLGGFVFVQLQLDRYVIMSVVVGIPMCTFALDGPVVHATSARYRSVV